MQITLASLPHAPEQDVFDQVSAHLLKQAQVSIDIFGPDRSEEDIMCAYRGEGCRKCAAGCLIADTEYKRDLMEQKQWGSLVKQGLVPDAHQYLITSLQRVHDSGRDYKPALLLHFWRKKLREIAREHQLSAAVLDSAGWRHKGWRLCEAGRCEHDRTNHRQ